MAQVYFTATYSGSAARIVVHDQQTAADLKAKFAARGVSCGGTFAVGPSFHRPQPEIRTSLKLLQMLA